jgi:hypothetical protein
MTQAQADAILANNPGAILLQYGLYHHMQSWIETQWTPWAQARGFDPEDAFMHDANGDRIIEQESWPLVDPSYRPFLWFYCVEIMLPRLQFTDGVMMDLAFPFDLTAYGPQYNEDAVDAYKVMAKLWSGKYILPNITSAWWLSGVNKAAEQVVDLCNGAYFQYGNSLNDFLKIGYLLRDKFVIIGGPMNGLGVEL